MTREDKLLAFDPWFRKIMIGKKGTVEIAYKQRADSVYIGIHGANDFIEFFIALIPIYKKWKGHKVHAPTLWLYKKIRSTIVGLIGENQKVTGSFFSQGAALAELLYIDMKKCGYKDSQLDFFFIAPYKAVVSFPKQIHCIEKDIVPKWPFFRGKAKSACVYKSPYKWFRFRKNHIYIQEVI
ncbi:MAG: hypothetical protein PVG39_01435 [Desulfobacteraceae bacterium]|jgi:hypothetical protein